jgi:hypothetical protein
MTMWKLDCPATEDSETQLLIALTSRSGQPVYKTTNSQRAGILKLYAKYDSGDGRPAANLQGSQFAQGFREAVCAAYDQVQEDGRLALLRASLKNINGKCPYCGIGEIGDLDHHLPRSTYRLLAIYARNLVPCCHNCNRSKGTLASDELEEHIAHVYLDEFPKERFFFARVTVSKAGLQATFSIQRCAGMTAEFAARLEFQITRFALNQRYPKAVNEFMGSQKPSIEGAGRRGAKSLRSWLKSACISFQKSYGLNDWRTALMQALADSDEFCEGGFRYCFGERNPGA